MKKPKALDLIKAIALETMNSEMTPAQVGRKLTDAFDYGAQAGMSQREVETFIMVTKAREKFRVTGRI